ncbi:MAG: tryptophan 2,3-dioxygenase [Myxococcota bacterium]|nr:tryptophan 2,3-dioxygenase family protein [Myxococcota bacterium]
MTTTKLASSYADYLKLPELLGCQTTLTEAHDELQFIIVHQTAELWFKLMIFELESTRAAMFEGKVTQASHYLRRVQVLIKQLIAGFEVIETMRPYDFAQFRDHLMPASGVQSLQYREVEFLCGARDSRYLSLWQGYARERLAKRAEEPTVWDAYIAVLRSNGQQTGDEKQVVASIIDILQREGNDDLGILSEQLIEFDEHYSLWRNRHVQMVMRMIGAKPGTGQVSVAQLAEAGYSHMGTSGVDYLRTTLNRVFFPLLWEARTFIQR